MKKKGKNISNIMTDVKFSDWGKWKKDFAESQKKAPKSFFGSWHLDFKKSNPARASFVSKNLNVLQGEMIVLKKTIKKQRIKFFTRVFFSHFADNFGFFGHFKTCRYKNIRF